MIKVVGVRFKKAGKIYYFDPVDIEISQDENGRILSVLRSDGECRFRVLSQVWEGHLTAEAALATDVPRETESMKTRNHLSFALATLMCCSCSEKPDTLAEGGYDEREMDAAIARARAEVDSFVTALTQRNGSDFSVKAAIEDKGETEHFWLVDVAYRDGVFEGVIDNKPGMVGNVKLGQKWTVKKSEISDWLFLRDGKMHGNYTIRPLLKTMPEGEAARYRSILAGP